MIEEEFGKYIPLRIVEIIMPLEAKIYAILHHKKAFLALVALQTFEELAINLRESPGRNLVRTAF